VVCLTFAEDKVVDYDALMKTGCYVVHELGTRGTTGSRKEIRSVIMFVSHCVNAAKVLLLS